MDPQKVQEIVSLKLKNIYPPNFTKSERCRVQHAAFWFHLLWVGKPPFGQDLFCPACTQSTCSNMTFKRCVTHGWWTSVPTSPSIYLASLLCCANHNAPACGYHCLNWHLPTLTQVDLWTSVFGTFLNVKLCLTCVLHLSFTNHLWRRGSLTELLLPRFSGSFSLSSSRIKVGWGAVLWEHVKDRKSVV